MNPNQKQRHAIFIMADQHHNNSEIAEAVAQDLIARGKPIEAGWVSLRMTTMWPDSMEAKLRHAFYAGAQHVFSTLSETTDDDSEEPTEEDLQRVEMVDRELHEFYLNDVRSAA